MLRYFIAILLFVGCSSGQVAQSNQDYSTDINPSQLFLYQQDDAIKLLTTAKSSTLAIKLNPCYQWEGTHSHVTIYSYVDHLTMEYRFDIIGPYWFDVTIEQIDSRITVTLDHTGNKSYSDVKSYSGYSELASSHDQAARIAIISLNRLGQYRIPTLPDIRAYLFDKPDALNDNSQADMLKQMSLLNDDSWVVRDRATTVLGSSPYVDYLYRLTKDIKLSDEAGARVDSIMATFDVCIDRELLNQVEKVAFDGK